MKYAGATTAVVGASALGLDYVLESRTASVNKATGLTPTKSSSKINHPPVASFKRKPWYLNPTDQQTIEFTSNCYDADNDPLTYAWYVDGNRLGEQKDYSTKLSTGDHAIRLDISDGLAQDSVEQSVTVAPGQIYPTRPLHLRYKGTSYCVGTIAPEWDLGYTPDKEMMGEQLDTIHDDLGCNAIVVDAGVDYEDNLIECSELALEKGFERVYVQPRYMGLKVDETIEKIGEFGIRVRALREASERVVFSIGHEFGLETAIVRGDTWFDRADNLSADWQKVTATLPGMFAKIIRVCKESYGYKISYSAIPGGEVDLVPWENPIFESVGADAYVMPVIGWSEDTILTLLSRLKIYQKPVFSMETGCMTFKGAAYYGGVVPRDVSARPYDEDEQAGYIKRYCDMLNRARIDGYFYTQYNDNPYFENGYGLYNGFKRKKGFYMYKSYERAS